MLNIIFISCRPNILSKEIHNTKINTMILGPLPLIGMTIAVVIHFINNQSLIVESHSICQQFSMIYRSNKSFNKIKIGYKNFKYIGDFLAVVKNSTMLKKVKLIFPTHKKFQKVRILSHRLSIFPSRKK